MKVLIPTTIEFAAPEGSDSEAHGPEGVSYYRYDPLEPVPSQHRDADAMVTWFNTPEQLKDSAKNMPGLKWVQTLAAGANNVLNAGFGPDVIITNGRGLHDATVAEHTVALLLCAARRLHLMRDAQHQHRWPGELGGLQPERSPDVLTTLNGASVLIWGFGSIAAELAPMLTALGADVRGVATSAGSRDGFEVVASANIDDLLPTTDALVMILPAVAATQNALDARRLGLLPRHAWVVNVGRGDSIDSDALVTALTEESIGGAALDVFKDEPLPASSPLWAFRNVIISPHAAGGRPIGAETLVTENVRRLLAGEKLKNTVDRAKGY